MKYQSDANMHHNNIIVPRKLINKYLEKTVPVPAMLLPKLANSVSIDNPRANPMRIKSEKRLSTSLTTCSASTRANGGEAW